MKTRTCEKDRKAMSEALKSKADTETCKLKHSELDKHMQDLKEGNRETICCV